jgi:hypothetical protein
MEIFGMFHALSLSRSRWLAHCALAHILLVTCASADVIDLSLNVIYNNASNPASGGTWEVVAKTDGSGLSGLQMFLTNVATSFPVGPRGLVNGSDPAGFSLFVADVEPIGFTEIIVGQILLEPSGLGPTEEQSAFYGVGTLTNGAPNYPTKPPGTNSIGPAFTSLNAVQAVPWATGDRFGNPAWNTAALLVRGTFNPGVTPGFFQSPSFVHSGNIFTSTGTNKIPGNISEDVIATAIVRTNLSGVILPDYNLNGRVDAADFALWRKTFGQVGSGLAADGNNNGSIDQGDYDLWRMHFGQIVPPSAGQSSGASDGLSTSSVPEPASAGLLVIVIGAMLTAGRRRIPRSRAAAESGH